MQSDPANIHSAQRGREVPDALRRALVSAAVTHDIDSPALYAEVCEHVRVLRRQGLPPEVVIVAMKEAVRSATLGLSPSYAERREGTVLVERVVKWCIEEYYAE